jgi:hypothetical protein
MAAIGEAVVAWNGMGWHGAARPGVAVTDWQGKVRLGAAGLGGAW